MISKCVVRFDVFPILKQMQQIMPRDSTRNQTLKAIKPQPKFMKPDIRVNVCSKAFILFVVID